VHEPRAAVAPDGESWFEEKMILDFMLSNNSCWMGDQPDGESWFEEKMILDFMLSNNSCWMGDQPDGESWLGK